jgi:hypothetical protein
MQQSANCHSFVGPGSRAKRNDRNDTLDGLYFRYAENATADVASGSVEGRDCSSIR